MGPVEVLSDWDGVTPPPPGGGQSENITSRGTTYVVGNQEPEIARKQATPLQI